MLSKELRAASPSACGHRAAHSRSTGTAPPPGGASASSSFSRSSGLRLSLRGGVPGVPSRSIENVPRLRMRSGHGQRSPAPGGAGRAWRRMMWRAYSASMPWSSASAARRGIMSPQQNGIGPKSKPCSRPMANARRKAASARGRWADRSARWASISPASQWCQRHTAWNGWSSTACSDRSAAGRSPTCVAASVCPSRAMCSRSGQPLARPLATAARIRRSAPDQSLSSIISRPRWNS